MEEYGLLGGIVVILIYLIFLFRCITIANRCETIFPGALVLGLAFLIATQAFLHIMVNVGLMPVTGHTLPLISHGGTAYMVLSGAFGIILSVSKNWTNRMKSSAKSWKKRQKKRIGNNVVGKLRIMSKSNPRIIISGGGTGGHIFPALLHSRGHTWNGAWRLKYSL